MGFFWSKFATEKNRWFALIFLSLGLAIVIIDNSVLNVAIPYILRDLHTSFDAIQWVISGYALIIATVLITIGRLGDLIGRKKVFLLGTIFFAIGSFIASIAPNAQILFLGEAFIEAIGAAMMLTSSLALLATEFQGKERSLAFGVWGSVAGASATIGPMLGGYLTSHYSWRWSLRINVIVTIIAILGSIFIKEARGEGEKRFDWFGTFFSGLGLFSLVFGFIEGQKYGWWIPNENFSIGEFQWPFGISIIPVSFALGILSLIFFCITEYIIEKKEKSPLLKLSMFKSKGFSLGLLTLGIATLGQFGMFFILPIYLQNVLGLDAFTTGIVFLPVSLTIAIFGPLSGIISSKVGPKWVVSSGMVASAIGTFLLSQTISLHATSLVLAPGLALFGIGIGMTGAQLTNIILSAVPPVFAGESSAASATIRQIGTSIGVAIIGVVLAASLSTTIVSTITTDTTIPTELKASIINQVKHVSVESGQKGKFPPGTPQSIITTVTKDINQSFVDASKNAINVALVFIIIGALASLWIPNNKPLSWEEINKQRNNQAKTNSGTK
ncbi:MAG TPA: DHA2 family efflux MFS transporter permease subunit [Candidatus Saccharimonadales bacterium]|nr:DHA2 family efflux MFS transporter permease subunit [Candidatus Saccharimonadales bacterium]